MRNIPIATRAYIKKISKEVNNTHKGTDNKKQPSDLLRHNEIIVFDTETTEGRIKNDLIQLAL